MNSVKYLISFDVKFDLYFDIELYLFYLIFTFSNAKLQGPAPFKTNSNNIPFSPMYYDNVNNNEKAEKVRKKFNDIQSDHLKNVFKNSNIVIVNSIYDNINCPEYLKNT